MTFAEQLREEAAAVCRAVALEDLRGRPLYVVWVHEVWTGLRSQAYGCVHPLLDLVLRPVLQRVM